MMIQVTTVPGARPAAGWRPANLEGLNRRFEGRSPQETLRWALTTYGDEIVMATGFGPSGIVLMHMVSLLPRRPPIFYLQTDLFFPETLALRDRLAERLQLRFVEVKPSLSLAAQARRYGSELWARNPDLCCHLRKVLPLRQFLTGRRAWITGIRRDQTHTRRDTPLIGWDAANGLVKVAPLAGWTKEAVWAYIRAHDLQYNALHDQGYPSIGCIPCTSPADGEERAGRWAGREKQECGIHIQPDGRVIRLSGGATS